MLKYCAVALISLCFWIDAFADPTGAAFLKIPNGAAEISLGMSGVAHSRGSSAAFWNPARIGLEGDNLGLQFFRWHGDGRGTVGAVSIPTQWGGLSAYIFDLSIDDFEARHAPGPAEAIFTVHQSIAAVAGALRLPMEARAGLALKGYIEDIYGDVAAQFPLIDAGISWTTGVWSVGLASANIMLNERVDNPPPVTGRVGVSRRDLFGDFTTMVVTETAFVRGLKGTAHIGIEGGYRSQFFLRGGVELSADHVRPTFGLGLETGPYRIDAAMALFDEALGSTWRIGLGYRI